MNKNFEVLLVEDSPSDADLTLEALEQDKLKISVNLVTNGALALSYLRREGEYENATRPQLVLLDLNLPKKNGLEVLDEMKKDPCLQDIPVVILSTSDREEDILASYNLHANCYVTKPVDMEQFTKIVSNISKFWFCIVELPEGTKCKCNIDMANH